MKKQLKKRRVAIGEYNRSGYFVQIICGTETLCEYAGGNCLYDSTTVLVPGEPGAMSLRAIRNMCLASTRDFAQQYDAVVGEIERIPDKESS